MKIQTLIIAIAIGVSIFSCKKDPQKIVNELPVTSGTVLKTASFTSNAHSTSGTVKIVKDATNKLTLVFENFKTDGGPDLRVWLATDNNASAYQEIGLLKGTAGNFSYDLPSTVNYTTNNRVLIWCKSFSVLFGHAIF